MAIRIFILACAIVFMLVVSVQKNEEHEKMHRECSGHIGHVNK